MADSRQYRSSFYLTSAILLVIVVAILGLLNLTSDATSRWKIDCSRDKLYSISDATADILGNLKDDIAVTYYCSEEMSSLRANLLRDTRDMFEEFRRLSGGKFKYEILDPDEKLRKDAEEATEEYFKKRAKGDEVEEPQRPLGMMEMLSRRERPTDEQVRERRQRDAATIAKQMKRDEEVVYRELVTEDYKEKFTGALEQEGVRAFNFLERKGSSARQVRVYSAIKLEYLNKQPEVIPLHQFIEGLEYELAHRIVKLTTPKKPTVAFFDGRKPEAPPPDPMNPPMPPRSEYAGIMQVLGEIFDVREISLKEGDAIDDLAQRLKKSDESGGKPSDTDVEVAVSEEEYRDLISVLVVAQPDGLEERQVYEISRAVSLGIPTVFLVSPYVLDSSPQGLREGLPVTIVTSRLEDLWAQWGFELGDEMLASNECGSLPVERRVNIGIGVIPVSEHMPLPFIVSPSGPAIDQTNALTNNVGQLAFPATGGLKLLKETLEKNGIESTVLAESPEYSWSVEVNMFENVGNPFMRNQAPGVRLFMKEDLVGLKDPERYRDFLEEPVPVAALLKGKFPFLYEGKPIPAWKKPEAPPSDAGDDGDGSSEKDLLLDAEDPLLSEEEPAEPAPAEPAPAESAPAESAPAESAPAESAPVESAPVESAPVGGGGEGEVPGAAEGASPPANETTRPAAESGKGAEGAEPEQPKAHLEPVEGDVVILGSAEMMKTSFLQQWRSFVGYRNNIDIVQNVVELFGLNDNLLQIRRKTLTARQFKEGSDKLVVLIWIGNQFFLPLLVAVIGGLRYLLRWQASVRYERKYVRA